MCRGCTHLIHGSHDLTNLKQERSTGIVTLDIYIVFRFSFIVYTEEVNDTLALEFMDKCQ